MTIRPLQDRILVKRIKEEEKTAGGLFIPDSAKEKPSEGEIIAVGTPREVLTPAVLERTYGAPMEVLEHGGMLLVTDSPRVMP